MTKEEWAIAFTNDVVDALIKRRKELGLSVAKLSERTKLAGYHISTAVLTNLENKRRGTRLDLVELLVLSGALEYPPGLFLFPQYPDGEIKPLPAESMTAKDALDWFAGRRRNPLVQVPCENAGDGNSKYVPVSLQVSSNKGQQLVEATRKRDRALPDELENIRQLALADLLDETVSPERLQAVLQRANWLVEQLGGTVKEPQKLTSEQSRRLREVILEIQLGRESEDDGEG